MLSLLASMQSLLFLVLFIVLYRKDLKSFSDFVLLLLLFLYWFPFCLQVSLTCSGCPWFCWLPIRSAEEGIIVMQNVKFLGYQVRIPTRDVRREFMAM